MPNTLEKLRSHPGGYRIIGHCDCGEEQEDEEKGAEKRGMGKEIRMRKAAARRERGEAG